jgi:hypothetical protein
MHFEDLDDLTKNVFILAALYQGIVNTPEMMNKIDINKVVDMVDKLVDMTDTDGLTPAEQLIAVFLYAATAGQVAAEMVPTARIEGEKMYRNAQSETTETDALDRILRMDLGGPVH